MLNSKRIITWGNIVRKRVSYIVRDTEMGDCFTGTIRYPIIVRDEK